MHFQHQLQPGPVNEAGLDHLWQVLPSQGTRPHFWISPLSCPPADLGKTDLKLSEPVTTKIKSEYDEKKTISNREIKTTLLNTFITYFS